MDKVVWTAFSADTVLVDFGKPHRPSTTAIEKSCMPRSQYGVQYATLKLQ